MRQAVCVCVRVLLCPEKPERARKHARASLNRMNLKAPAALDVCEHPKALGTLLEARFFSQHGRAVCRLVSSSQASPAAWCLMQSLPKSSRPRWIWYLV